MADGIIDVVVNKTRLSRSIDDAFAASRTLQKPIDLKLNTRGFSQPLGKIRADLNEFDKSLDAASARVLAFGASVGVINGVSRAFRSLVKDTIAVEQALTEINVVLGASASQLQQFGRGLFEVARNTQQSFSAAAEAATEFSRQGLSLEQTLKRTNDALTLTRLSGLDAAKAVEALTAAVNGFSDAALTTAEVVNRLAAVDAAFAVSSQDLAEALSRAGSSAQDANVQFNELLALTTSVQQQTARGGAVIGNAFKTIFARISRGTSIDQLRELGVAIDETQTGVERLRAIGRALENTDGITANKIKEIAGGVRQINIISAAFRDLNRDISLFDGALTAANTATDEAEIKIAKLNQTLADLVNDASLNIQELSSTLGNIGLGDNLRSLLQGFNAIVGGLVDAFNDTGIGAEIGKSIIAGIGNFLTGPGLAAAAGIFLKIFTQIAKDSISAVKSIGGLNVETERQANLQKAITSILTSQNAEYQSLLRNATSQAEREQVVLNILNQQVAAQERLQRVSSSIAGSSTLRGFNVSRSGGITRVPTAASGMLPTGNGLIGALAKETAAVSRGVGGASSSAKAVVIPNFNFGNGRTGPLVANTDEYILKNADGKGGSAILTKQMVKELGGPKAVEQLGGTKVPTAQDGTVDRRLFQRASEAASNSLVEAFKTPSLTTNLGDAFGETLDKALVNVQSKAGTTVPINLANIASQDARVANDPILRESGILPSNSDTQNTLKGIEDKLAAQNQRFLNQSALDKFNSNQKLSQNENARVRNQLRGQEFNARGLSQSDINSIITTPSSQLSNTLKSTIKEVDAAVNRRLVDQATTTAKLIAQEQKEIDSQNLQKFRDAQRGQGRLSRLFGSTNLPEFQNLNQSQQGQIRREQSIGGRARRVGSRIGRGLSNPLGLSFAASIASPLLQNAATGAGGNQTGLGRTLNVAGGAASGAALGAILGPQGAAIGALIGGLKSLAEVADSAANNVQALSRTLEEQQAEATAVANSIQQVLSNQQRFAGLIGSGANPQQLRAAQQQVASSVSSISDSGLRGQIRDILSDSTNTFEEGLDKIAEILATQQQQNLEQTKVTQGILKANAAEVEGRSGLNSFFSGAFGETDIENSKIAEIAAEFAGAISQFDVGRIDLIRFALDETSESLSRSDIADTFRIIGLNAEETNQLLDGLGQDFDLPELLEALKDAIDVGQEVGEFIEFQAQYRASIIESSRALDRVISTTNRVSRIQGLQRERAFNADQGSFDVRLAVAQFADPIAEGLVELAKSNEAIAFQQRQGQEELAQEFRSGVGDLVSSGGTPEAIQDLLRPLAENPSLELTPDLLLELIQTVEGTEGSQNAQFDGVKSLLSSLLDSSLTLENNTGQAADAANRQFAIAQARAREEQRQQNVNFLGGIEGLLNSSPNRFQTFENRGVLDRASANAGIFGGGASREAARGIVEFQEAFRDFGVDLREFAPETDRIVRDAVGSSIADFASRFPDLNLDVAQITDDIANDLFGDNELTSEGIASAIGSNSTVTAIETNTNTTVAAIDFLTRELQRNLNINDITRQIADLSGSRTEAEQRARGFEASSANIRDQIADIIGQSSFTREITADDVRAIGGDRFSSFANRQIEQELRAAQQTGSFGVGGVRRGTEDQLAERLARAFNRAASEGNVGEVFQTQEGILNSFFQGVGLLNEGRLADSIQSLTDRGLVNTGTEINQLRSNISSNDVLINFERSLVDEFGKKIDEQTQALENVRSGLNPDGSSISSRPTSAQARAGGRVADTSGADFERAALNASLITAATRRRNTITGISEGFGGRGTAQSQRIGGVLNELADAASTFATKTEEEVIRALDDFDARLEALGADLDDSAVRDFVAAIVEGRRDLLSESERQITGAAIGAGRGVAANRGNPFQSNVDFNSQIDQALRMSQALEQAGENAELFNQEFSKVAGIELPDTAVEKFAFGFKSAADEMTEALGNIQDIGAQVASTLAEGFADVFLNAIDGSEDLGRSLRSLFSNLLADLARVQAQQAFSKLFSAVAGGFGGGAQAANSGGQILKRNSGGKIHKFNQGGRVPTLLTSGEFVAGPDLVRQYGLPFFQSLNSQSVNASGSSPASGKPLGGDTQGFVTGGSGTRDDRFHMLEAGSFVLNRAASERYNNVIGSLERGERVNVDTRRPQKAFWGALIGQFLGGAATGAVVGAATAAITGEDIGKGALLGGIGGGIGGVFSAASSGSLKASGNGFFSDVGSGFKSGLTFGLGDKKKGSSNQDIAAIGNEAGSAAGTPSLSEFNVLTEYTNSNGKSVNGSFLVSSDQQSLFQSVNGTNKIFQQGGELFAKQGTAFNGKKINLATGEVTRTGILQSDASKQLLSGVALQLASSALAPSDPSSSTDTSIPYQAGFVIDTDPNGTVTVMGEQGVQKFKMGPNGDIQSLDQLKGIVNGYRRGGFISLDNFASTTTRNNFLSLVRDLALSTPEQSLAAQGSFRNRAKSKNPVSSGIDTAIMNSLRARGVQMRNMGGPIMGGGAMRQTAVVSTPLGPMIVGSGSQPNRREVTAELSALSNGSKGSNQSVATGAQKQVDSAIQSAFSQAYMDQVGASIQGLNFGGSVLGGLSGMDSVPTLLERGEFVQPQAAVGFFGEEFMRNVQNRNVGGLLKNIQRFEEGGRVDTNRGGNFSTSSNAGSTSSATVSDGGGLNGSITFDINFNLQSGGEGRQANNASEAKKFEDLVARLQPAIKAAIANELRTGGQIANGIDNRG